MKRTILFTVAILLATTALSYSRGDQDTTLWVENPAYFPVDDGQGAENAVGINIDVKADYVYSSTGELQMIHTLHRRIRLLSDEAINGFNKLSVSMSDVVEIIELKARVIKPDASVVEFNKNNIREIIDPDSRDSYKIFAIDGIEKGDDLEYLIVRRMNGSNFGREYFQFEFPVLNASFELSSPENLVYAARASNAFPQPVAGKTADGRNLLACDTTNLEGLHSESYFYQNAARARVDFKLEFNYSRGKSNLLRWSDAAQRIYELIYSGVDPKAVQKWLKTIDTHKGSLKDIAARIEDYIKSNVRIDEADRPEYDDLEFVRTRKVTDIKGAVRLYANLFRALDIKHEIVLTSERDDVKFDPDFQSWNYLKKYLIYLPDVDMYIDPEADMFRIGCVTGELTATYGLFVSLVKIGDFESGTGRIKYIEPAPYKANYDNMFIEISSNPESGEVRLLSTRGMKGLSGGYIGRIYENLDEQRKPELLKSIMESKASNPDYSVLKVLNSSEVDFLNDADFLIYSDFTTASLVETAGDKLLMNFGEIIGPQVELYNEENKERSAESDFNRWYYRRLVFRVPEGYKILNPEAADLDVSGRSDGEVAFSFVSTHSYTGDLYTVDIDEYYKKIFIEPGEFNGFRNVVNAAANFNKVVLILEKQ